MNFDLHTSVGIIRDLLADMKENGVRLDLRSVREAHDFLEMLEPTAVRVTRKKDECDLVSITPEQIAQLRAKMRELPPAREATIEALIEHGLLSPPVREIDLTGLIPPTQANEPKFIVHCDLTNVRYYYAGENNGAATKDRELALRMTRNVADKYAADMNGRTGARYKFVVETDSPDAQYVIAGFDMSGSIGYYAVGIDGQDLISKETATRMARVEAEVQRARLNLRWRNSPHAIRFNIEGVMSDQE
jgi:hypothetical protein